MQQAQVTLLIPHYKTLELTKLCLRLIRKFTDPSQVRVIVIDNQSEDISTDYLRSLSWITFIERKIIPEEGAITAHSSALDLGLKQVETPYVLSFHTDTLVKNSEWLPFLISKIQQSPRVAGVGSWKLEFKSLWRQALKNLERHLQLFYYQWADNQAHAIEGKGKNYYYLRSHCAMYRMDLIHELNLSFSSGDKIAGKNMHKQLRDAGYEMVFLPSDILIHYLTHINHATTILHPELRVRGKEVNKGLRRIEKILKEMKAYNVLADNSLDK